MGAVLYNKIMKNITLIICSLFLSACATMQMPSSYTYREVKTPSFTLATWVKDTNPEAPVHFYIEGDGRAFTASGFPSKDPTPNSTLMRDLAADDTAPNVAYIARPCQFVKDPVCTQKDWTTDRFSPKAVVSMGAAVKKIAKNRPVQFYAYSGGALMSGLIITHFPEIKTEYWLTLAGLLNHTSWTKYQKLDPLTGSLDLKRLPNVPQMHYVAEKDKVIPYELSRQWTDNKNLVVVPGTTHRGPFVLSE